MVRHSGPRVSHMRSFMVAQEATKATPLLSAAAKQASVELKKVLRRVHVPQNKKDKSVALKPFGRMLAKVAAANPLAVAETMIAQVRESPDTATSFRLAVFPATRRRAAGSDALCHMPGSKGGTLTL